MLLLYNAWRVAARGFAAAATAVLFNGKAEPFGLKFEHEQAVFLSLALAVVSWLAFSAESRAKKSADL